MFRGFIVSSDNYTDSYIEVMQLMSHSDTLGYLPSHEWPKSGRFYSDLRNKSSSETCVLSASTASCCQVTIILNKFDEPA